jgi:hypothetical protein
MGTKQQDSTFEIAIRYVMIGVAVVFAIWLLSTVGFK